MTASYPLAGRPGERLRGKLLASILLHGTLFVLILTYSKLDLHFGGGKGGDWGSGGAMRVNAVASLPGVPLPSPIATTSRTVAVENPGLHKAEPEPKPVAKTPAVEIPKFQNATKPEKLTRVNKRIMKEDYPEPENAIPFGQGGKPAMNYSPVSNAAGSGGLNFGEGGFGERYSWYVAAVRSRISGNSSRLLSMVSPNIVTAPRVVLTFDIERDGSISNLDVIQSSGFPEVDRSARGVVLDCNPLGSLPPDYSGNKVSVQFYFDFQRH
jgi:periplasmic protein TonB